ncbi:MAG: DinB family protein [Chitinophagaceae bacterium]
MNILEVYILNFEEIRRRSIMLWKGLPEKFNTWKPDKDAESFIEVIRHVLECEQLFHMRIIKRGILTNYISPWSGRILIGLEDELKFAEPFRNEFVNMVRSLSEKDLDSIEIIGKEKTQTRKLGDYLLRAAYHESVHAGQFLSNLRTLGIDRPYIWD